MNYQTLTKLPVPSKTLRIQALLGAGCVVLGAFFIASAFEEYLQIETLAIGMVLLSPGLIGIYNVLTFPVYHLSDAELVIRTRWKSVHIQRGSIQKVTRVTIDKKTRMLVLEVGKKQIAIVSDQTPAFEEIEDWLRNLIAEDSRSGRLFTRMVVMWAVAAMLPLVMIAALYWFSDKPTPHSATDLIKIDIVLAVDPTTSGRGFARNWKFVSRQHPAFRYLIDMEYLSRTSASRLHEGDTVGVYISEYDYQTKLIRTIAPKWTDRHLKWDLIRVYGIEKSGQVLVDPGEWLP